METKNEMSVGMLRMKGDAAPFVKVDYIDQNANEQTALLVVDSCSCHNILFGKNAAKCGVVLDEEEGTIDIGGAGNVRVKTCLAKFHFTLGGKQFYELYCVNDGDIDIPMTIEGLPLIGILGNQFMIQYRLTIDYTNYTLHTSNVSQQNLTISDCDYFFPMEFGLERYKLPVVGIKQHENEVVMLADTGATNNIIASQSIKENGFDCRFLDSTDVIVGIAGNTEVKEAMMSFCLLSLTENVSEMHHKDLFKVTPNYLITPEDGQCDKDGVQLPPIEGLIGSPFMAAEGWVLDFGAKIIYKRKKEVKADWD